MMRFVFALGRLLRGGDPDADLDTERLIAYADGYVEGFAAMLPDDAPADARASPPPG